MKFSTDGKKVACSRSYESPGDTSFDLFDFDPSTGVLSNAMAFDLPANRNCAGIDFSPDSKKLYVAQTGSTGESGLYQFNLQLSSQVAIQNSRKLLHKEIHNGFRQLQLAPDGKIYITKSGGGGGTEHLGVISQLNELADNVVVEENGLYLEGGSSFVNSTPNFIQNYLFKTSFSYEGTCQSVPTQFEITNTYQLKSVEWSFGEGSTSTEINPEFVYEKEGIYTVVLIVNYADHSDVITKEVKIDPFPILELGNGLSSSNPHLLKCKDQSTSIFVTAQNIKAYQWYYKPTQNDHFVLLDNEDQSLVVADKEGIYYCRLLGNSCYIDSPEFNVEEEKMDVKILNVSPQYICSENFTSISINSVAGEETIWFFRPPYINSFEKIGVGEDLIIKNEGEYFCKVIGQNCEFYSDTLSVLSSDKTINIEPIEAICSKNKIIYLKASPEGGKWSGPGIADQDVGILDPSGLLNGRYQIEYLIQQNGCNSISRIEFVLDNLAFPRLEYEDTDICLSKAPVLTIDNYLEFEQFEWYMISDKVGKLVERGNSMKIQEIGKYYVQAFKHSCMIASDTVSFEALTSIINVPNVFTPNGDAVNENFYLNTENIEDFKLKILNRWGKLVFSTNSITNYWEANDSPPGIYYWFINYRDCLNKDMQIKGSVHVLK